MKKVNFVKATVFVVAVLSFGSVFTSCKDKNAKKITHIGYFTGDICNAPMHVAMEKGFFQEEFDAIGQEFDLVSRVQATTSAAELVASGKMDAGTDLAAAVLPQIENGLDVTFVTGYHTGCTKFYAKAESGIKTIEDFKGKKVAIPGLTDSAFMNIKRKLEISGIKTTGENSEVEFIVYETPSMPIALSKGDVDIVGLHDPVATIIEKEYGFTKVFDIGEDSNFKDEFCCQAFVSQRLAKENPDAAKAFTKAILKAAALVQEVPYEVAQLQLDNEFVTGTKELNGEILDSLDYNASIRGGKVTVDKQARDLKNLGFLKTDDIEGFIKDAYTVLEGIPDGYTYNKDTKEFIPVNR